VRRAGLEWVYRLIQEPRRLASRYLIGNVRFLIAVFGQRMSRSSAPPDTGMLGAESFRAT
jgi:UDP-N-acetyl-D-mannosaminuronic acid transferase (WecB/TagA/CpsF family)